MNGKMTTNSQLSTNEPKQIKERKPNKGKKNLHLLSMIILNWTTQMVIIWLWKLGCKTSIFKNVKSKCPFAGKHGTEWIPTARCPRLFIPYKLSLKRNWCPKIELPVLPRYIWLRREDYGSWLLTVEKKVPDSAFWGVKNLHTCFVEKSVKHR